MLVWQDFQQTSIEGYYTSIESIYIMLSYQCIARAAGPSALACA